MFKDFHRHCDNMGATITLIRLKNGSCLGAITLQEFQNKGDWKIDPEAIIFNLTNNSVFEVKKPDFAMATCSARGPWFGEAELSLNKEPFNTENGCRSTCQ